MHRSGRVPGLDAPGQVPMRVLQRSQAHGLPEFPYHRQQLTKGSGISEEVIAGRGYSTVKSKAELERLGFSPSQRRVPALLVPMYAPTGERVGCQIKPDSPRCDPRTGKEIKYETPVGSEVRLDIHPWQAKHARDASVPL